MCWTSGTNIKTKIMERTGNLRKLINVRRPRCASTAGSPPKFERGKLSLRSENVILTGAASATTATETPKSLSSFSLFRQVMPGSTQKHLGKENELPFALDDHTDKSRAAIVSKSTIKRRKSLNPTKPTINSEKDSIRRRLSADYGDLQLSSNKLYEGGRELVQSICTFPPKVIEPLEADVSDRHDIMPRFSIYNDEINRNPTPFKLQRAAGSAVDEIIPETYHGKAKKSRQFRYPASSMFESSDNEENVKTDESCAATQEGSNGPDHVDSHSIFDGTISGSEFQITRIDSKESGPPALNKYRKIKSGSDIGRLNVPLRRGDDISPLKRRMNRLKRKAAMTRGRSGGNEEVGACTVTVAGGLTSVAKYTPSDSKMGLKSNWEVRKFVKPNVLSLINQTRKRKYCSHKSATDPSNGAIPKTYHRSDFVAEETAKNASTLNEPLLLEVENKIMSEPFSKCKKSALRSAGELINQWFPVHRKKRITGSVVESLTSDNAGEIAKSLPIELLLKTTIDENKSMLKFGKFIPRFCQPALRDESLNLKDNYIQFVYNDLACNNQAKLQRANNILQNSLPCLHLMRDLPIAATVFQVPRAIERRQLLDDEPSCTGSSCIIKKDSTQLGIGIVKEILYATDYTDETLDFERAREGCCYKISQTFLKGKVVTPIQRRIVVHFLISVHAYLSTNSSTLYHATKIFDSILDIKDVPVEELQLVALGAFWIAIKNMESLIPTARKIISFAKDMYGTEGPKLLCKCERNILETLSFNIRFPDPFYISAYYLHRWSSYLGTAATEPLIRKKIYHCAGYLMDIALLDKNYSGMPAELLAAVTTETAAHLVLGASWEWQMGCSPWMIGKMPRNFTREEMKCTIIDPLLRGVLDSAEKGSSAAAVYKKYKSSKYDNISDYFVMETKKLAGPTLAR